jgi:hypothetical protein
VDFVSNRIGRMCDTLTEYSNFALSMRYLYHPYPLLLSGGGMLKGDEEGDCEEGRDTRMLGWLTPELLLCFDILSL